MIEAMDDEQFVDALNTLDSKGALQASHAKLAHIMIKNLAIVEHLLPPVIREARDLAREYWVNGTLPSTDMATVQDSCWGVINANGWRLDLQTPASCASRGVTYLLTTSFKGDEFELLNAFSELMYLAGVSMDQQTSILSETFSDELRQ